MPSTSQTGDTFPVSYDNKVHVLTQSIQERLLLLCSEYDYLAALSTVVLTQQSRKWMRDHKSFKQTFLEGGLALWSIMCPDFLQSNGALPVRQLLTWRPLLSRRRKKKKHQLTKHQTKMRKVQTFYFDDLWCFSHVLMPNLSCSLTSFCDTLTEGEQDSGGVSWRASSGWFPDQSREGDVLGGSASVITPPPSLDSSCSTLTPAILTSPPERRCSAGGLGSTILLKDKHKIQY